MNAPDLIDERMARIPRYVQLFTLAPLKNDVDLKEKLAHWERFYNPSRLHGGFNGKAPYEALREKL